MWIKICGITSLEDAKVAVQAEADAVGFVFAQSPRRVTPEAVREMTQALPSSVEKIGVFVDASVDEIVDTCDVAGLTGVQLHGEYSYDRVSHLPVLLKKLSKSMRIVHVVHYDGDFTSFSHQLRMLTARAVTEDDRGIVLVDTKMAGKLGGTGVPFDWHAAQEVFAPHAAHLRLIAAGGLQPDNVRQAIQTMRPWGVDVSSGVESVPCRKDRQRVREFIRAARAAATEFAEATR